MKLLGENIEVDLCDLRLGSGFLDTTKAQVAKKERERHKWKFIKIRNFSP